MKFHPLVAKVKSSITVRSLPEEWCRFPWCAPFVFGRRFFDQGRYERFAVIQYVRGKLETDTHEMWGNLDLLTMGGVFVFK